MSDQLSSEILESQFGPTKLEVLNQEGLSRTIITKAADSGQILEFSRVTFRPEGIAAFPEIHKAVVAGTSMGKAFSEANVPFKRETRATSKQALDLKLAEMFGGSGEATLVEVSILVGTEQIPYADILETYSPAVIWPVN